MLRVVSKHTKTRQNYYLVIDRLSFTRKKSVSEAGARPPYWVRPLTRHHSLEVTGKQGSFPVRKRTGTLRIWRARELERIWESGGGAPSGVQGQSPWSGGQAGEAPLKLKAFYCRREQISHSHLSET